MELTAEQIMLYGMLKNSGIPKRECVALLTLLNEKDIDDILNQIGDLLDKKHQLPTEQELMNILYPILMAKPNEPVDTEKE